MITRYVYIVVDSSTTRGFNRSVRVYRLRRDGMPVLVGRDNKLNSAAWRGAKAEAVDIVARTEGKETDGYNFIDSNNLITGL